MDCNEDIKKEKALFAKTLMLMNLSTGNFIKTDEIRDLIPFYWQNFASKNPNWKDILDIVINNCKDFPTLSKLNELARTGEKKETSSKEQANQIVDRIINSISKWGYNNQNKAQEEIGAIGWNTVMNYGGWLTLCETTYDKINVLRAQMRGSLEAEINKTTDLIIV